MTNHLPELLKTRREGKGLTPEATALAIGKSLRAYQYYETGETTPRGNTLEKLSKLLGFEMQEIYAPATKLQSAGKKEELQQKVNDGQVQEPMIQVILNLTYTSKKNADSIDRMAATNERNTDIIAALVAELFPNSKLAAQIAASPTGQHMGDGIPAEAFLGPVGTDALKDQKPQDKKEKAGK